jgi:Sec-independent protein translocase protein TatA
MAGFLVTARLARRHITTARDLRARWDALPPAQQDATRAELDRLSDVLRAVGRRLAHGPREFKREFDAAHAGVEVAPAAPPPSLGEIVRELGSAITALRQAMNAAARTVEFESPGTPVLDAPQNEIRTRRG